MGKVNRYKLLAGKHIGLNKDGVRQMWNQGDIVETEQDLSKLNAGPGAVKFQKLDTDDLEGTSLAELKAQKEALDRRIADLETLNVPAATSNAPQASTQPEDDFDAMTIAELTEYADTREWDISGVTKKAELIAALRKYSVAG